MRNAAAAAALVAVLAIPTVAAASPLKWGTRPDVVHGTKYRDPSAAAPSGLTDVSHVLFLNDCMPGGCDVSPGFDDSRQNRSSIPWQQSHLDAYAWGDAHWNQLVACVRETFAPFDIEIVTDDPGTANHFEVAIGGFDYQLQMDGALGVAPFIPCNGQLDDNVMTFVFASMSDNIDILCWAVAQEAAHAWGLDHELDANDPMTYLYPPYHKSFQDTDVACGEEEGQPRECWCGNQTQNSYRYLMDTFGPANPIPPVATIVAPADGAWVLPGFAVTAVADSQLSVAEVELAVDGTVAASGSADTVTFTTSEDLAGGDHHLEVRFTDSLGQTASDSVDVHVTARCGDGATCAEGFLCLGGNCLPDATTAGGLGATCTGDEFCITGQCWSDGTTRLCTQECDAERACPDGFVCTGDGAGTCWPGEHGGEDTGICAAAPGGGAAGALWLVGVALIAVTRRRAGRR